MTTQERLDEIKAMLQEIKDMLLYKEQAQAAEIDKFIEQWRNDQIERREVPIAD